MTIILGLMISKTLPLGGKAFSQSTEVLIILISISRGKILNGKVCQMQHALSLMTQICHSILGMCSLAAIILRCMPNLLISGS